MSRKTKQRGGRRLAKRRPSVAIEPQEVIDALSAHFYAQQFPDGKSKPQPTLRLDTRPEIRMAAARLWRRWGETFEVSGADVTMPDLDRLFKFVLQAYEPRHFDGFIALERAIIPDGCVLFASKEQAEKAFPEQEAQVLTLEELCRFYERLPNDRLERAAEHLRRQIANLIVDLEIRRSWDARSALAALAATPNQREYIKANTGRIRYLSERLVVLLQFLDVFYWDVWPAPTARLCACLPKDVAARVESSSAFAGPERALVLSGREIKRGDGRIDLDRFDFYTQRLGCHKVLEPEGWFGEHAYLAFLLRAANGARYVMLDCRNPDNAVYVLYVGPNAQQLSAAWREEAREGKQYLLQNASTTAFVRRIFHNETWRERLVRFLTTV